MYLLVVAIRNVETSYYEVFSVLLATILKPFNYGKVFVQVSMRN